MLPKGRLPKSSLDPFLLSLSLVVGLAIATTGGTGETSTALAVPRVQGVATADTPRLALYDPNAKRVCWRTRETATAAAAATTLASHPVSGPLASAIRELNGLVEALPPGSPLSFPDAALSPLDDELARATLVGLGEATHGTAEFFELKHRLFRHLVEVHGHRALAYEYGFAASLALDRYVMTGEGSLDALLSKGLWIQANQQVRSLLEWMRRHNQNLPEAKRVHFFGIDSQLDMWHPDVHRALFRTRYPGLNEVLLSSFRELEALGRIDYRTLSADEYQRIGQVLDGMAALVQEHSRGLSPHDRAIAQHLIEVLQRSHEFLYSAYQGSNTVRDGHLAANTLWVAHYLGEGAPFSVWAHDSHIGSIPTYYGPQGPGSMGMHLARKLGPAYYRVATAFTRGSFTAVRSDWRGKDTPPILCRLDEDPPAESVNALLERAGPDRYLVALQRIPRGTPLFVYLDRARPFLGVGDFFAGEPGPHYRSPERIVRLLEAFDAVFYFSNTRGIQPLDPPSTGPSTP